MKIPLNILQKAIKEASKSNVIRGKIGCCLFNNSGHIIASSHNTAFLGSSKIHTIHAEDQLLNKAIKINAIPRFGEKLNLLVIRWQPGLKKLSMAKPCSNCAKLLENYPFTIYYSDYFGKIIKL